MNILPKKILDSSQQKIGSAYAQSPRKCSYTEILAKIEIKDIEEAGEVECRAGGEGMEGRGRGMNVRGREDGGKGRGNGIGGGAGEG